MALNGSDGVEPLVIGGELEERTRRINQSKATVS